MYKERKSVKDIMSNWPESLKKSKKTQIKDWKNIHAEPVTVEKIWKQNKKKREKKNQKMWLEKEKKWKKRKKMKDNTNTYFNDFWVWNWCMFFVVLFC